MPDIKPEPRVSVDPPVDTSPDAMRDDGARYHVRMRDLPETDRPHERLLNTVARALSNAELLAIQLRTGTARESALDLASRLLAAHGLAGLQRLSAAELAQEHGLGPAKAAQHKAALELGQGGTTSR